MKILSRLKTQAVKINKSFYSDYGECDFDFENADNFSLYAIYNASEDAPVDTTAVIFSGNMNQHYPTFTKDMKLSPEQAKKEFADINAKIEKLIKQLDDGIGAVMKSYGYKREDN